MGAAAETFILDDTDLDVPAVSAPAALRRPPAPVPPDVEEPVLAAEAAPVIDCVDEVPAEFWAPGGAGLLRRAAALLVDQALLALLLSLFLAGAALALWRQDIASAALLSEAGLRTALGPLALLVTLVSFAYHVPAIAVAGRTPGKRLAGLEVRARDGSVPTWGKAALRWCGAVMGLACGGVGIAWALFEPRRRGWADLVSDTLVIERDAGSTGAREARDGRVVTRRDETGDGRKGRAR